jgi:two-component system KDP operon response regulator KdpE
MTAHHSRERPLILVVDDVASVIRMMTLELSAQGFDVAGAAVGDDTYRTIEDRQPDAVLMEVVLPGIDGFEVLSEVKRRYGLPVVFVTTQDSAGNREVARDLGADDFISKPFSPEELAARIRNVLRLSGGEAHHDRYRVDGIEIDLGRKLLVRDAQEIPLSTNEWAILLALARTRGAALSARDLLIQIWGRDYADDTHYLQRWIDRLRGKVERDPRAPRIIVGDVDVGFAIGLSPAGERP